MAPPMNTADAEPSVSMSTAADWVAFSGVKSSYDTPCAARIGWTKNSKPAPAGPITTRFPRRSAMVRTPPPEAPETAPRSGASVMTERIGYSRSQPSPPRTAKYVIAAFDSAKSISPCVRRRMFSCDPLVASAVTCQPCAGPCRPQDLAERAADNEEGAARGGRADVDERSRLARRRRRRRRRRPRRRPPGRESRAS